MVEPPQSRRASDYLWSTQGGLHTYRSIHGESDVMHHLTISRGGSVDDYVTDAHARPIGRTLWMFNRSNGTMSTCDSTTIWNLPRGYRQRLDAVYAPGPVIRSESVLCLDDSTIFVASKNDGPFHYTAKSGEWYSIDFPSLSTITAIGKDGRPGNCRIFAGTESDGIYTKRRNEANWVQLSAPKGRVRDIEVSDTNAVFALVDNQLWLSEYPFTQWMNVPLGSSVGEIHSISLLSISDDEEMLFVATSKSGLICIRLVDSYPTLVSYYNTRGRAAIGSISTLQDAPYPLVGIAAPSTLFMAPSFGLWIPVTLHFDQINCLVQSRLSGVVLIGTNDGIYRYSGASPTPSGLQGRSINTLNVAGDNTFYAGTDEGFYRSRSEGASWTRIDGGTVLTAVRTPWVLLPPTFERESSWKAAELVDDAETRYTITGRVLSVLDQLVLPSGHGRYSDAVVVRYAFETSTGFPEPGRYVWLAYFVRGKGLVWMEETSGGELVGTTMLLP